MIFVGVLTFLPLIQDIFQILTIKGLDGAFVVPDQPQLSIEDWNSSKFQGNTSVYLKHKSSFRPDFVRINNQLDYWLFNEINTILTLGKEDYIFDPNYIKARKGEDYLNEEQRNKKHSELIEVKQYLDSLNIPILFCFAPNKANYYAEYLPVETPKSELSNQGYYEKLFIKEGIPYINFNHLFEIEKKNSRSPLMPKYGAHWSTYGAFLAGVSLLDEISLIKNRGYSKIIQDSIFASSKALFTDDDYLASLNLVKRWKSPEMLYPKLSFKVEKKLNALIVSDSFFWNFYDLNIVQNCFSDSTELRYYNKTKFNSKREKIGALSNLEFEEIKNRDIIIIMTSDPGLKDLGYGFLEQISNLYGN